MAEATGKGVQSSEDKSEASFGDKLEYGDNLDQATFEQILEMDDDSTQEFSRSIVYSFFDQAQATFRKMELSLEKKDLDQLSHLGHFLKGSSATLGLTKVKDSCEKIQHYGARKDDSGTKDEKDDKLCLDRVKKTLEQAKQDYAEVEKMLKDYYTAREEK